MSKDFKQIAGDVMTGVGLLQQGSPDIMKSIRRIVSSSHRVECARYEDQGTYGSCSWNCSPLRRLRGLSHEDGASTWGYATGGRRDGCSCHLYGRRAGGSVRWGCAAHIRSVCRHKPITCGLCIKKRTAPLQLRVLSRLLVRPPWGPAYGPRCDYGSPYSTAHGHTLCRQISHFPNQEYDWPTEPA